MTRVGDWSEHISSSGKKYYYNCKTEVSQWEKPREWVERERERERERFRVKETSGSGTGVVESHGRAYGRGSHDKHSSGGGSVQRGPRPSDKPQRHWTNSRDSETHESLDPRRKHLTDGDVQATQQDMDISPGDSTPTSELSYSQHTPSTSGTTIVRAVSCEGTGAPLDGVESSTPAAGPVLLGQALPRLTSQSGPSDAQNAACSTLTPVMVPPPITATASANTPGT